MSMAMETGGGVSAVTGDAVWRGDEMRRDDTWIRPFSAAEIDELEAALEASKRSATDIIDIDALNFPLPTLGPILDGLRHEILRGRGFVLLRGLPVEGREIEDIARLYWGLGRHFGHPVSQNGKGHLLGHVRDLGMHADDPNVRVYQTTERQFYHADSCDIVALLCLRPAMEGGESRIVSSATLYNEMMRRRPDLAELLTRPLAVDRRGEVPEGALPYYLVPAFNHHDGLLTTYYIRRYVLSAQRFADAPRLSEAHIEAFDLLDTLADDPAIHLDMEFLPGDVQLLHNHTILHDRGAYRDWPDGEAKRHLLRLWLCPPDGRPLPEAYRQRWGEIEIGARGGIVTAGQRPTLPLEAV